MEIRPTNGVSGSGPIQPKRRTPPAAAPDSVSRAGGDNVQISEVARLLSRLQSVPDVRSDRVAEVRAAIEKGDYETPDKIRTAVDRIFDDLVGR
ncbi:MAG: flagellar biosynthesis anti-sigma factor FlgM [Planctomycetes bacterium]|nr:flagellar biosynthesis anti-sigma factor FlgM [Planctomycetota bacterium]